MSHLWLVFCFVSVLDIINRGQILKNLDITFHLYLDQ